MMVDSLSELEKKLRYLHWKKSQNENEIRGVLATVKNLQDRDIMAKFTRKESQNKVEWANAVIESEISKPLEVTDEFIEGYELDSRNSQARFFHNQDLHMKALRGIRSKVRRLAHYLFTCSIQLVPRLMNKLFFSVLGR